MGGDERRWIYFTCRPKWCTEVAVLVKEVAGMRQMVEFMIQIAGQDLEDKGAESGSRETEMGVAEHLNRRDGHRYRG